MGSRILIHNLGYPRVGALRQLKKSLEAYWRGASTAEELQKTAAELRRVHWLHQKEAGIDLIPCGDFSLYDHVLDAASMVGAVPERFGWKGPSIDLPTYFAMARGKAASREDTGTDSFKRQFCGRARDGNDQVVRHELPLHRAGIPRRPAVRALFHEESSRSFRKLWHSASRPSPYCWDRALFSG